MGSLPLSTWFGAGLAFLAIVLLTLFASALFDFVHDWLKGRGVHKQLNALAKHGLAGLAPKDLSLLREKEDEKNAIVSLIQRLPLPSDMEVTLEQSGMSWTLQKLILLSVGFGAAFSVGSLIATGNLLISAAVGGFASTLPYMRVKGKRRERLFRFEAGFPEAIDLLGRSLRAGYPPSAGFKMVAEESDEPIAGEFRRVFEQQRFGLSFDESLMGLADRVPLTDVRIFATAIMIQREVGGNLAEILDNLATIIRQRFTIRRDIQSKTAQGRLSAYVLLGIPPGMGIIMTLMDHERMFLFFNSFLGQLMITGALVFQLLGFFWIRSIVRIEV